MNLIMMLGLYFMVSVVGINNDIKPAGISIALALAYAKKSSTDIGVRVLAH